MPKYESVIIFDNLLTEEEVKNLQERIRDLIQKEGGEVTRVDFWGKKRLTFDIKKKREGYYTLYYFTAKNSSTVLTELERFCHIEEKVLRHMICHEVPSQFAKSVPVEKQEPAPPAGEKEETEQDKTPDEETGEEVKPAESQEAAEQENPEEKQEAPEVDVKDSPEPESGN